MKICPNCQQEMDDSFTTCENCGTDLIDLVEDINPEGAYEEMPEEIPEITEEAVSGPSFYEADEASDYQPQLSFEEQPLPQPEEPELDIPAVEEAPAVPEEPQRPQRRTPSAFGARTPGSMARPTPRSTPTRAATAARRSTPAGVNARRKAEEEEREKEKEAQREQEPTNYAASFRAANSEPAPSEDTNYTDTDSAATRPASSGGASSMEHRTPSLQQRMTRRDHPEWNMDNQPKTEEDGFKPVPPFMTAEEADRPSPFAPAKNPVTSDKSADVPRGKASLDVATTPSKRITSNGSEEISVSVRICPSCRSRCFSSEKTCKNCGYQFPKAGALASLSAKSTNILAMLAALAMAISVFTNIITYKLNGEKVAIKLIDSFHGFGFLALAALAIVFAFSGKNVPVIIVGLLSAIAAAAEDYYLMYDLTQVEKYGNVDQEIGFWLLAAGAALIFAAGIYGMVREKKRLEQFTSSYMNSI